MRGRVWSVLLLVLSVVFIILLTQFVMAATGLNRSVEKLKDDQQNSEKSKAHFVLIAQEYGNPYWTSIEKGALKAGEDLQVQVEYIGPIQSNMEEQLKLLEKSIASNVDGIIVQSLNNEKFTPLINKAINKGIPVITIDTDAPSSNRLSYVGTDNYFAGQQLGLKVLEETGGKGKIGVIIGDMTAENQKLRLNGLKAIIGKRANMEIVEVLPSNISRIKAGQQAEKILRSYPEVTILVGTSALDAVGMLQAKENLNRHDVKIFGFDDVDETIQAIKDEKVTATLVQKPYEMGYKSIRLMYDYFKGNSIPNRAYTDITIVDSTDLQTE
ncbi:sugar-binding protein [Metabacillus malikii]|uniref:Ribose transport system substrate-binding protein n=1 Tax=Metabacillus malikii TaxID=1504265 RepID=A0ABT9ZMW6_9BACI|nr:sugar-binding protein [Metabacillus malikii]MDQ0233626.1 ribose transport system substrate-binding protein [Metabacillus malikii]